MAPEHGLIPRRIALAALAAAALLYAVAALASPASVIGMFHDDGIYVGSALSLARGEGYRIPHLPGAPLQAKYPPLYPTLLVPIAWMTDGAPEHLNAFRWPSVLATVGSLALLPGLLRRWGMSARAALVATALTAVAPLVFQHALHVMSEAPFMLLSLAALRLVPGRGEPASTPRWIGAGLCAAGAVLCRSLGVAMVPALGVAMWPHRRDWRAWTALAMIVVAMVSWMTASGVMRAAELARDHGPLYDYCLGYGGWIRRSLDSLPEIAWANTRGVWAAAGNACAGWRLLPTWSWMAAASRVALGTLVVLGWLRLPRVAPIAATYLGASLALVIIWPFPVERFLVPLTPFIVWGAWSAGCWLCTRARVPVVAGYAVAAVLGVSSLAANLWHFPSAERMPVFRRYLPATACAEVAVWMRTNTEPEAVVISDHDPWVYLATGRRAIPPGPSDPLRFYRTLPEPSRWQAEWPERWGSVWLESYMETQRLGADWILAGPTWERYHIAVWSVPINRDPRRFVPRYAATESGPQRDMLQVFEMR